MASILDTLQLKGAASLSDAELIALIIDDGSEEALHRAEELIDTCGGVSGLCKAELSRLRMSAGIGIKRAAKIAAAAELGRRMVAKESSNMVNTIASSDDVAKLFRPILSTLNHEECWAIFLSNSNRIIEHTRISQGGVQSTVVDHRLLIKRALELLSTRIILVHNHPSGSSTPSQEDISLTKKVMQAAALFDIEVIDHIIISSTSHTSLKAQGFLK